MNDEKLIELVHSYPVLYDLCNAKYMDSNFKNAIWRKIGAHMQMDGSSCKTRWANIRDNFRKSLNKQKTTSGQKATKMKPYKYSEQLNFLKIFLEERKTKTNIEADEVSNEGDNKEEEISLQNEENTQDCTVEINDPMIVQSQSQNSSTSKPGTVPRKKLKHSVPNNTPAKTASATGMEYILERNKCMNCPPPPQDPVDSFLIAIAPVLKKLSPREWHFAKGEIFTTVQKYEYNMLMNRQQFVDPLAISSSSTPIYDNGQPSPAESYMSTLGDNQQSRSSTD